MDDYDIIPYTFPKTPSWLNCHLHLYRNSYAAHSQPLPQTFVNILLLFKPKETNNEIIEKDFKQHQNTFSPFVDIAKASSSAADSAPSSSSSNRENISKRAVATFCSSCLSGVSRGARLGLEIASSAAFGFRIAANHIIF
jgi:hypothetical protein